MEITHCIKKGDRTIVHVDGHAIQCFGEADETANYFINDTRCVDTCDAYSWPQVIKFILENYDLKPSDLLQIESDT